MTQSPTHDKSSDKHQEFSHLADNEHPEERLKLSQFFSNLKLSNSELILPQNIDFSHQSIEELDRVPNNKSSNCYQFKGDSNYLTTLRNINQFKHAKKISLRDNEIEDLENLYYLRELSELEELDLRRNRITEHSEYINIVLLLLPNLKVLDGKAITEGKRKKVPFIMKQNLALLDQYVANESEIIRLENIAKKLKIHKELYQKNSEYCQNHVPFALSHLSKISSILDDADDSFKIALQKNFWKCINLKPDLLSKEIRLNGNKILTDQTSKVENLTKEVEESSVDLSEFVKIGLNTSDTKYFDMKEDSQTFYSIISEDEGWKSAQSVLPGLNISVTSRIWNYPIPEETENSSKDGSHIILNETAMHSFRMEVADVLEGYDPPVSNGQDKGGQNKAVSKEDPNLKGNENSSLALQESQLTNLEEDTKTKENHLHQFDPNNKTEIKKQFITTQRRSNKDKENSQIDKEITKKDQSPEKQRFLASKQIIEENKQSKLEEETPHHLGLVHAAYMKLICPHRNQTKKSKEKQSPRNKPRNTWLSKLQNLRTQMQNKTTTFDLETPKPKTSNGTGQEMREKKRTGAMTKLRKNQKKALKRTRFIQMLEEVLSETQNNFKNVADKLDILQKEQKLREYAFSEKEQAWNSKEQDYISQRDEYAKQQENYQNEIQEYKNKIGGFSEKEGALAQKEHELNIKQFLYEEKDQEYMNKDQQYALREQYYAEKEEYYQKKDEEYAERDKKHLQALAEEDEFKKETMKFYQMKDHEYEEKDKEYALKEKEYIEKDKLYAMKEKEDKEENMKYTALVEQHQKVLNQIDQIKKEVEENYKRKEEEYLLKDQEYAKNKKLYEKKEREYQEHLKQLDQDNELRKQMEKIYEIQDEEYKRKDLEYASKEEAFLKKEKEYQIKDEESKLKYEEFKQLINQEITKREQIQKDLELKDQKLQDLAEDYMKKEERFTKKTLKYEELEREYHSREKELLIKLKQESQKCEEIEKTSQNKEDYYAAKDQEYMQKDEYYEKKNLEYQEKDNEYILRDKEYMERIVQDTALRKQIENTWKAKEEEYIQKDEKYAKMEEELKKQLEQEEHLIEEFELTLQEKDEELKRIHTEYVEKENVFIAREKLFEEEYNLHQMKDEEILNREREFAQKEQEFAETNKLNQIEDASKAALIKELQTELLQKQKEIKKIEREYIKKEEGWKIKEQEYISLYVQIKEAYAERDAEYDRKDQEYKTKDAFYATREQMIMEKETPQKESQEKETIDFLEKEMEVTLEEERKEHEQEIAHYIETLNYKDLKIRELEESCSQLKEKLETLNNEREQHQKKADKIAHDTVDAHVQVELEDKSDDKEPMIIERNLIQDLQRVVDKTLGPETEDQQAKLFNSTRTFKDSFTEQKSEVETLKGSPKDANSEVGDPLSLSLLNSGRKDFESKSDVFSSSWNSNQQKLLKHQLPSGRIYKRGANQTGALQTNSLKNSTGSFDKIIEDESEKRKERKFEDIVGISPRNLPWKKESKILEKDSEHAQHQKSEEKVLNRYEEPKMTTNIEALRKTTQALYENLQEQAKSRQEKLKARLSGK